MWLACALTACDSASIARDDAGSQPEADVGPPDARPDRDLGTEPEDAAADAGSMDAGPMDAGPMDAGPMDAGPMDAGPMDAGPLDYHVVPDRTEDLDLWGSAETGAAAVDTSCSTESVVTGLRTWVREPDAGMLQVTGYQLVCRTVRSDGTLGSPTYPARAGIGEVRTEDLCADDEVVVAIHGHVTDWPGEVVVIGRLGVACAPLIAWTSGEPVTPRPLPERGTYMADAGIGFSDVCSPGYVQHRWTGRSGAALDSIRVHCVAVEPR